MVIVDPAAKAEGVEMDADLGHPEVVPFFYSVPCPGVKHYTYDYRRAQQMRISRWAEEDRPERLIDCG